MVAAGRSERFGSAKLLEPLGEARVIDHAVGAASLASEGVVLVTDDDDVSAGQPVAKVVAGGQTRSASVRAGLAAVPADVDLVLVHDAARPAASVLLFQRVIAALDNDGVDAVVPVIPVTDTVKRVDGSGLIEATLDRTDLVLVQTPQGFRRDALENAHASDPEATDDAALIERGTGTVVTVPGEVMNLKVTTPFDLELMRGVWNQPGSGVDV